MIKLLEVDIPPTAAKLVTNAVNSGVLTKGKFNQVLAEDLAERHGFKYGVTCSNGTVAFELIRRIVPGIRTMVPSWTYHSPAHKFGDVVWTDVDPTTFQSEKENYVKKAHDGRTHNVLRSYVYGGIPGSIPSNLLYSPGWNKGKLIDDASHILDTTKNDHQSSADFFVASMYATKPIAAGEGGIILTNDQSAYEELLMYRDNDPNYGVNARLSEMNAALGYSYLAVCDERRAARNKIGDIYREAFGFDVVSVNDYLFPVNCDKNSKSRVDIN